MINKNILKRRGILYLVTNLPDDETRLCRVLEAGVDLLQLREKNVTSAVYLEKAMRVRRLVDEHNDKFGHKTLFIVNDRLDIALLSKADGVHLGSDDVPVAMARTLAPSDFIIGATAKTVKTAVEACRQGADYLGTGAFAATSTKPDATLIKEETYKSILENINVPDFAIGGLTVDNADVPLLLGASGLAVSSAIMGSENPAQAVEEFRRILK